MTDELFLMAFCCINSDFTHLLLKATITAKSHLGKARPGRVSLWGGGGGGGGGACVNIVVPPPRY